MSVFKNKLDRTTKRITALCFLIFSAVLYYMIRDFVLSTSISAKVMDIIIIFIISDIITFSWLLSIKEYCLDGQTLVIRRIILPITIKLADIKSIQRVDKRFIHDSLRIFGNGGFLGFYGIFKNSTEGRYHSYCADLSNLILIETDKKKMLISPENADIFLEQLKSNFVK